MDFEHSYLWDAEEWNRISKMKGNRKQHYHLFLQSSWWQSARKRLCEGRSCNRWNCTSPAVDLHHTTYRNGWACDDGYLIPLCRWHHGLEHNKTNFEPRGNWSRF